MSGRLRMVRSEDGRGEAVQVKMAEGKHGIKVVLEASDGEGCEAVEEV